jgi:NAD(P)-dependent dehydrogenase (short-subunit alcohol dehydrogenase family)
MSVRDKVVIITGGAEGVGRYVARTFAVEGARVAIADIASMDNVAREISELGAEILPVKTDITREPEVRSLMEQVHRRWGRIDVLINDAGINPHFHIGKPRWPRIRDMPLEQFNKVMNTNLMGTFLCTKHVLPYMESLNDGHIINFGQGNVREERQEGARPNIGTAVYNTSKIAIRAFTRNVADEEREFNVCIMSMGPGGRINSSDPEPPRRSGPGIPGGGGGIVTEDSPEWARSNPGSTMVEAVGNRYVIAAEAPIEFSGHQVFVRDGKLYIATD